MRRLSFPVATALAVTLLLAALSLVTWRQARAYESLAELDRLRRAVSLEEAERAELERRIQHLESRARVVREARERLGMRTPSAEEIVILTDPTFGGESRDQEGLPRAEEGLPTTQERPPRDEGGLPPDQDDPPRDEGGPR